MEKLNFRWQSPENNNLELRQNQFSCMPPAVFSSPMNKQNTTQITMSKFATKPRMSSKLSSIPEAIQCTCGNEFDDRRYHENTISVTCGDRCEDFQMKQHQMFTSLLLNSIGQMEYEQQRFKDPKQEREDDLVYEQINKELTKENKRMSEELETAKLELKHCIERIQMPLLNQLENQRRRSEQLKSRLNSVSSAITNKQCFYNRDIKGLHNQLYCNCKQLDDITDKNSELYKQMRLLKDKCKQLQDDILRQQMSKARTLERLNESLGMKQAMGDHGEIGNSEDDDDLEMLDRALGQILSEIEDCYQCQKQIPNDLKETVKGIQRLIRMVKGRSKKTTSMKSVTLTKKPSPRPIRIPSDLTVTKSVTVSTVRSKVDITATTSVHSKIDVRTTTSIQSKVDISIKRSGDTINIEVESKTAIVTADQEGLSARLQISEIKSIPSLPLEKPINLQEDIKYKDEPEEKLENEEQEMELEIGGKDINITTSITKSGNLEIITESPTEVIESTLTLTKSGHIDVSTDIIIKPELKPTYSVTSYESKTSVELSVVEDSIISEVSSAEAILLENLVDSELPEKREDIKTDIDKIEETKDIASYEFPEQEEVEADINKEEELAAIIEDVTSLEVAPEEETQTLIGMEDIEALLSKPTPDEEIIEEESHLEDEIPVPESAEEVEFKPEECLTEKESTQSVALRMDLENIESQEEVESQKEELEEVTTEDKLSKEIEIQKSLDFGSVSLDLQSTIGCKSIKDAEQETEKLEIQEAETSMPAEFQEQEEELSQSADLLSAIICEEPMKEKVSKELSGAYAQEYENEIKGFIEEEVSERSILPTISMEKPADEMETSVEEITKEEFEEEINTGLEDRIGKHVSLSTMKLEEEQTEIAEVVEEVIGVLETISQESLEIETTIREELIKNLEALESRLAEKEVKELYKRSGEYDSFSATSSCTMEWKKAFKEPPFTDSISGQMVYTSKVRPKTTFPTPDIFRKEQNLVSAKESPFFAASQMDDSLSKLRPDEKTSLSKFSKLLERQSDSSIEILSAQSSSSVYEELDACPSKYSKASKEEPKILESSSTKSSLICNREIRSRELEIRSFGSSTDLETHSTSTGSEISALSISGQKRMRSVRWSGQMKQVSGNEETKKMEEESETEQVVDVAQEKQVGVEQAGSDDLESQQVIAAAQEKQMEEEQEIFDKFEQAIDVVQEKQIEEEQAKFEELKSQTEQVFDFAQEKQMEEEQAKSDKLELLTEPAIGVVQEKQMELDELESQTEQAIGAEQLNTIEEQTEFNEFESQTEQSIDLDHQEKKMAEGFAEFDELKSQIEQDIGIEQEQKIEELKLQMENIEEMAIESDRTEVLVEKISTIKQEEAVLASDKISGTITGEQKVSKLETQSAERLTPRRPSSPKRPGSPGKSRGSRTSQGSQEDRESKKYRDTREEPDKYKSTKDRKTCDCKKCTCEICSPEILKNRFEQMTADDCTCLPDCTCPVCSLSLPNMKKLKDNIEEDKWLTEGFGNKNLPMAYSKGQHPPGCECLDCLCNPPDTRVPDISKFWHLEDCDCLLCKCCACTDNEIKTKNPYVSGQCLFEQARAKEHPLSTEEKTDLSTMSDVLSEDTRLSESVTKKLSIVQIPRSSIEQQYTQVITISQTITNTTIQSEFIETKTPHPTNCDCFDCLCENTTTVSKTPSSQHMEQTKPCECSEDKKHIEDEDEFNMQAIADLENIIKQTGSAFLEANVKAENRALLEKSRVARQTSSFILTMSGLKVALSSLQSECNKKDRMIAEMLKELKIRANSKVFDSMLRELATVRANEPNFIPICQKPCLPKDIAKEPVSEPLDEPLGYKSVSQSTPSVETHAQRQLTSDSFAQEEQQNEFIDSEPIEQLGNVEEQPLIPDHTIVVPLVCSHPNYPRCPCANKMVPIIKVFPEEEEDELTDQQEKPVKFSKKVSSYIKSKTGALPAENTKPCHKHANKRSDSVKIESYPKHHKKHHKCQCKENQPSTSKQQQQQESICPECRKRLATKEKLKVNTEPIKSSTKPHIKLEKEPIRPDSKPCTCTKQSHKKKHSAEEKDQSVSLKKTPSSSKKCRCSKANETRSPGGHKLTVDKTETLLERIRRFLPK